MALVTKNFTLNVTPGAMPPTVHVSEYDIGRTYAVQLLDENGSAYEIPTGTTATVEGTLNGTVGFTTSATIDGNQISFALTESMTAYAGKAWCKVKLTQNSQPIQTCAFILAVDRAGVEADTVIGAPGFEEQIRGAVDDSVAEYLNDFAIDDEVVRDAVDDYLDENGIDTESITTATTDWLNDNVTPVGSAVVVDSSLSVEGAAADAAAVGAAMIPTAPIFEGNEHSSASIVINSRLGSSGFVPLEIFDVNTGEPKTVTKGSRTILFPVKPGSTILLRKTLGAVLFDKNKRFVLAKPRAKENGAWVDQTFTIPDGVVYMGIYGDGDNSFTATANTTYWGAFTNFWVTSVKTSAPSLVVDWNNIYNRQSVNEQLDIVDDISTAFDIYPVIVGGGNIVPIQSGKTYYPYTDPGGPQSGAHNEWVRFLDENLKPIKLVNTATGTIYANMFRNPIASPYRDYDYTYAMEVNVSANGHLHYFSVTGTTLTGYNYYSNPKTATTELASEPKYIQLGIGNTTTSGLWTVGKRITYNPEVTELINFTATDRLYGFMDSVNESVNNNLASGTGEIAAVMQSKTITTVNRMRHAFRVGSFNIYGASYNQRNWSALKDMLQNYGIDFIGFQEVYQPNSTNSEGKTFQQALTSWQFTQFAVIQTEDVPGNCRPVAATSDFEVVGITEVKYTQQSHFGHRHYTRTELQLPKWKDKKWSEYLKVSVYNTQLEAGAEYTSTRLAQAAELISAMTADANPFVVLVGDFNEMSPTFSVRQAFIDAGFVPVLPDESTYTTAGSSRGYYDNIFVNDRIQIVGNDVVPSDKYKFENGTLDISDHDLVIADIVPDYTNIITVKKNDTQNHCTISGVGNWLDRRQTEPVTVTITPDSGYTFKSVTMYQGDSDVAYGNNPFVISGNTVTIYPSRIVGDIVIAPTCEAS